VKADLTTRTVCLLDTRSLPQWKIEAKTSIFKNNQNRKEVNTLAFTRKEKEAMVAQYKEWVESSQAFFVLSFQNMGMPAIDEARAKLREVDGELHVVKNRLFRLVTNDMGLEYEQGFWEENNLVSFAFDSPPEVAKVLNEISKTQVFSIRSGYMDDRLLSAGQVKALADLPTKDVMRGILLSTIQASATQLVRTLAEPARSMAAVVKAFSEKDKAAEPVAG
jgi:large subunit ribosomal protein L10